MPPLTFLRETSGGILLSVKLQPRAARNEIGAALGDELRIKVTAPPVDAAANQALVEFLAETLKCPKGKVSLIRGHTSRHKTILLHGLTPAQITANLPWSWLHRCRLTVLAMFHHLDWIRKKIEHAPIKLEKHTVSDPVTGYARPIRLLRSPTGQSDRLCLFLDGELYREKMNVLPVLRAIQNRHALTFAFIDHLNMTAREQDYTGNDQFGRFIGEKVVPWLEQKIPGLRPGQYLIGGLSLSGLESAWLALQYPGHFRYCLSQSGSFWWNQESFIKMASQHARINTRFWLSVGDQETEVDEPPPGSSPDVSQIEGVKNARRVLKAIGSTVYYHEYHGGHDMKYWRAELDQAVDWLLAGKND